MRAAQLSMLQAEQVADVALLVGMGDRLEARPAEVLSFQCQLQPKEAGRAVRLAKRLAKLPAITEAFAAGRLSEGTVEAMCRVANPENEARILEVAATANAAQLAEVLQSYQRVKPAPDPQCGA